VVKLAKVLKFIEAISEWTGRSIMYLLLPLMLITVYEVIARYVFNHPTQWVQETSTFMYGGVGILAGAYVLYHNGHIRLDYVYNRFSPRGKAIVDLLVVLPFIFLVTGVLVWKGWGHAVLAIKMDIHSYTPRAPPLAPIRMVLPIAAFLLLLQGLNKLCRDLVFIFWKREL